MKNTYASQPIIPGAAVGVSETVDLINPEDFILVGDGSRHEHLGTNDRQGGIGVG